MNNKIKMLVAMLVVGVVNCVTYSNSQFLNRLFFVPTQIHLASTMLSQHPGFVSFTGRHYRMNDVSMHEKIIDCKKIQVDIYGKISKNERHDGSIIPTSILIHDLCARTIYTLQPRNEGPVKCSDFKRTLKSAVCHDRNIMKILPQLQKQYPEQEWRLSRKIIERQS